MPNCDKSRPMFGLTQVFVTKADDYMLKIKSIQKIRKEQHSGQMDKAPDYLSFFFIHI